MGGFSNGEQSMDQVEGGGGSEKCGVEGARIREDPGEREISNGYKCEEWQRKASKRNWVPGYLFNWAMLAVVLAK